MALIKNIELLNPDSNVKEVFEALQSSPLFYPGKVADELDPENKVRKIRKLKNLDFIQKGLEEKSFTLDAVIDAFNVVSLRRSLNINKWKQPIALVNMAVSLVAGSGKLNTTQQRNIQALKTFLSNIF